jgi:cytoskeletal protein RodZ
MRAYEHNCAVAAGTRASPDPRARRQAARAGHRRLRDSSRHAVDRFILGIVAVTRSNKWASKHGVGIIVASIVFFVVWIAVIALGVNTSVKKAEHQFSTELSQASEQLKREEAAQERSGSEAKARASDASAKELARTAETTAETIAVDNNGSYASVTPTKLQEVEQSITLEEVNGSAYLSAAKGEASGYTVTTTAGEGSGHTFAITKNAEGGVTRTCEPEGQGGCPADGKW